MTPANVPAPVTKQDEYLVAILRELERCTKLLEKLTKGKGAKA